MGSLNICLQGVFSEYVLTGVVGVTIDDFRLVG